MYNQALCLTDVAYFKDDIRVFPVVSESTVITIAPEASKTAGAGTSL